MGSEYKLLDATGAVFFNRELEHIKAKSFDVLYADLKYREIFPVSTEVNPGATQVTYRSYDSAGKAQVISGYAGDLPRADVAGAETSHPVRMIGSSYGYNLQEIKSSQMTGKGLDARRAMAARRAVEEQMNLIAFDGNADSNLPGLLSDANVPAGNVANGAAGTPAWTTKTPDEILYDLNVCSGLIFSNSKGKERPNTCLLPIAQWNYLMSTPRSSGSDMSIAGWLVNNSPFLKSLDAFVPLNEMDAAGAGGGDIFVLYDKNPEKLSLEIPEDVTYHPVQETGLEFVVPVTAFYSGLHIYYPLSLYVMEDI